MYMGGLTTTPVSNIGKSSGRLSATPGYVPPTYWSTVTQYETSGVWYSAIPAIRDTDQYPAEHPLAADLVFFTGGPGWSWDLTQPRYIINHRDPKYTGRPAFQNILYADGHVDGIGPDHFSNDISTANWSFWHNTSSGTNSGGGLYWNGTPDPPPPTGNPNPAPPSAPSSPSNPTPPAPTPVEPAPLPSF
jgi:hypothetical protein